VVIAAEDVEAATGLLSAAGEQVWTIGTVRETREGEAQTVVI
jgi:phosphoribosylformylglycinamidine cyclo-ligase